MSLKPTVVSMFSGCGGADLGFKNAGFDIVWANDFNADACETYTKNIGDIHHGDVTKLDIPNVENLDVLVAGFPCQPFSNAGSRKGSEDPRGLLVERTFDFIHRLQPKVVVFENVRGLLSIKIDKTPMIEFIRERLKKIGYQMEYRLLNFSHFGVPQNRIRVVIVANKTGRDLTGLFPEIVPDCDLTIATTLKGLTSRSKNQKELMKLNPQALELGKLIPEGGSWKDLPDSVIPERWMKIRDNMAKYHYPNFFRRFARHEVQGTITAAFKPENAGVWHPMEQRIYSVREIARFQSFPDDFEFFGSSVKSKYQQIGNAIPPKFAFYLAQRIKLYLSEDKNFHRIQPRYCHESLNVNRPLSQQQLNIL